MPLLSLEGENPEFTHFICINLHDEEEQEEDWDSMKNSTA